MNKHLVLIITLAGVLIQPVIGKCLIPSEKVRYEAYFAEQNRIRVEKAQQEESVKKEENQYPYEDGVGFTENEKEDMPQDDYVSCDKTNDEQIANQTFDKPKEPQIDEAQVQRKTDELIQKALDEAKEAHKEQLKQIEAEKARIPDDPVWDIYRNVIKQNLDDENRRYSKNIQQIKNSRADYENMARAALTLGVNY